MKNAHSRRHFLQQTAVLGAAAFLPLDVFAKKSEMKLGYSAITWGGNDAQAIQDIAALGFKGIQLRANTFGPYKAKPSELKAMLEAKNLALPMFSSGNVEIDPAKESSTIDTHVAHASFVKALGGMAFQMTNNARPKDRLPTTEELKRLATVMNKIGQQTADMGIQATYHNHMNQLGETPEEVDVIVQALNPKYVRLLLDVAHYHQGGGDPVRAVGQYKDILYALHLKDTQSPIPGNPDPKKYKFVELGQGNVNLPGVFKALEKINFKGWGIVELDGVPDKAKTPMQCGEISRAYLKEMKVMG
ncbi:MAG: sugar phosphate isomerase/epimerase [Cytophagaceae bacterium]|nr:sugar phosphate isomerase/epimerase [Cytophagaceae bacterium]